MEVGSMRKLASVVIVVALMAVTVGAFAKGKHTPKPNVKGAVTSVVKDGDTLKSFVIKQGKKAGGAEVTVEVAADTTYARPKKQPATAADIKVGAKVTAYYKETVGTGPAVKVMVNVDAPADATAPTAPAAPAPPK
jgi:hypothetical protein